MCTIIVLNRVHPYAPLVVAANRDEVYARPSEGPRVLRRDPLVVGGRDLKDGGTWMGVSDAGLFVGLTNVFAATTGDHRSRGEIVLETLGAANLEDAVARLEALLAAGSYRAFNLLLGTTETLHVARHDEGQPLLIKPVPAGVHVLPSTGHLNDSRYPKVQRVHQLLDGIEGVAGRHALEARLVEVLADHHQPTDFPPGFEPSPFGVVFDRALQALCVHTPAYGTRSASVVFGLQGGDWEFANCEGAPCEGVFEDVSALLSA